LRDAQSGNPETASHTIRRLLLLTEPPSIDTGEITDKGYIKQRAVLQRRAACVDTLYQGDAPATLIQ
jgi:feruloyl-CoA synthase